MNKGSVGFALYHDANYEPRRDSDRKAEQRMCSPNTEDLFLGGEEWVHIFQRNN